MLQMEWSFDIRVLRNFEVQKLEPVIIMNNRDFLFFSVLQMKSTWDKSVV